MANEKFSAPDPFATFDEKLDKSYGVSVARFISRDWFGTGVLTSGGNSNFLKRRDYIRQNRLFVRAENDIEEIKKLETRGPEDLSMQNLSWKYAKIAEKYCRKVSNAILEDNYKLDIRSSDPITMGLQKNKIQELKKNMIQKPFLENASKEMGINVSPTGYVPEDEDDLNLYLELQDRPKIEIAEQLLINFIKKSNTWDFVDRQTKWDMVIGGLLAARVYIDKQNGVKIKYVDVENLIHSYIRKNDFSDLKYAAEVDTITLSDLIREANGEISETKARDIARMYGSKNGTSSTFTNYSYCDFNELLDYKIDVVRFVWLTSKTIVFKKKIKDGKTVKVSMRDEKFYTEEKEGVGMAKKVMDTWLEGTYVIGSDVVYGYKECENLERDSMDKAVCPFIIFATDIYENRLSSFLDSIKVPIEQMQGILIQLQKLRKKLRPDTTILNIDVLAELDDGQGGVNMDKFNEVIATLNSEGVVFEKTIDMGEAGHQRGVAANSQAQQQGSGIGRLLELFVFYGNQIREITGLNPYTDGAMNQDALVGVTELAQMSANTSIKHYIDTAMAFNKRICEVVSTRLGSIYRHKDAGHLRELYNNIIGKELVDGLEVIADRHLHEFGFTYEMYPTNAEIKEFKDSLNIALTNGQIDVAIESNAKSIAKTDIKLATKYLLHAIKQANKRKVQDEMALSENKSQNDAKSAQAAKAAEVEAYKANKEADLEYKQKEVELELYKAKKLKEIEEPYLEKRFNEKMKIEVAKGSAMIGKTEMLEENKEKRLKEQATMSDKSKKTEEHVDFTEEVEEELEM